MRQIKLFRRVVGVLLCGLVMYVIFSMSYAVAFKLQMVADYQESISGMRRPAITATPARGPGLAAPVEPTPAGQAPPPVSEVTTQVYKTANALPWSFRVTAGFGQYPSGGAHYGIDVDATYGVLQFAPVGGTITEIERGCTAQATQNSCGNGFGNHIWWKTDPGTLGTDNGMYIVMAHFKTLNEKFAVGVRVEAGDEVGVTGATGYADGPHMHLQRNPNGMENAGSLNPAWVFPWLRCGDGNPKPGDRFGAGC